MTPSSTPIPAATPATRSSPPKEAPDDRGPAAPDERGPAPGARRPRQDVLRNRARLLEAARHAFAREGCDAGVDGIARDAGVGSATLYRHFPAKGDLIAAVLEQTIERLERVAGAACRRADPWAGIVDVVHAVCDIQGDDRAVHDAISDRLDPQLRARVRGRLTAALSPLVDAAHASGALRPDVSAADFVAILRMVGAASPRGAELSRRTHRRYAALVLDGLRARPPEQPPR